MKLKFPLLSIGLGTLALVLNTHCTKINPTDIGTDLLPAVDNVHTFQTTLRVYADNYLTDDSTLINYADEHALGTIEDDPEFGKTEAEIYLGLVPSSALRHPFINADSIVGMDSVILSLAYTGIYGDSNTVQAFDVFEISDPEFKDSSGYLAGHPGFSTTLLGKLGGASVSLQTIDDPKTIIIKSDTQVVSNLLRIPLDTLLGKRFAAYDTSTVYVSSKRDSVFQKVFNGLVIKTDESSPQKSALTYYNLLDENTKLTCYYRVKRNGNVDTLSTDFALYVTGVYSAFSANTIKRTPMHGYAALDKTTAVPDAEKIYLQSAPGSYAILNIPGLDTMGNRIIHRAELAFEPISLPGNTIYTTPDFLFIDLIDSAANRYLTIPDDFNYSFSSYTYNSSIFGGYVKNDKYFFNLTRYVQNKVTKQSKNYALRLSAPQTTLDYYTYPKESGSLFTAGRVAFRINSKTAKGRTVIGGGSNPSQPMQLRIIYSKI